jgi:hypothetical protein
MEREMNDDDESASTSFKDKMMNLYAVGVFGFTAVRYSDDGFWIALGKAMIWPISVGLYLVEKFS